jgi:hypothetical protein
MYYASGVKFLFCFPSASFNGGFPFLALSRSVLNSFSVPCKQNDESAQSMDFTNTSIQEWANFPYAKGQQYAEDSWLAIYTKQAARNGQSFQYARKSSWQIFPEVLKNEGPKFLLSSKINYLKFLKFLGQS